MPITPQWLGRRKDVRGRVCATAVVTPFRGEPTEHIVEDLSAGGLCLLGRAPAAVDQSVKVELALPGQTIALDARIVRVVGDVPTPAFALSLLAPEADARRTIEHEVAETLRRGTREARRILIVEPAPDKLKRLMEMVRPVGEICLPTGNMSDALWFVRRWTIQLGLLGLARRGATPAPLPTLLERAPKCRWRRVDSEGRLRAVQIPTVPAAAKMG